jgi:lysophosphatidate acyltransferase
MAKRELAWAPLLGGYLSASGAVFVDRGNNAAAVRSLTAAGDFMKNNTTSLWLFPEGTRSMRKHHDLLPFKKGAFHTAVQAGVPVTPVVCENYWRLYHKGHFEGGVLKIRGKPEPSFHRSRLSHFTSHPPPGLQSCHRLAQPA